MSSRHYPEITAITDTTLADYWGIARTAWLEGIPEAPTDPNESTPIFAAVVRSLRPRDKRTGRFMAVVR